MTDKKQSSKYSEVSLHLSSKLDKSADGKPRKTIRCFNCRLRKDTRRSPYLLRIGCIIQGVLYIIQTAIYCVLIALTTVTLGTAKTRSEKQNIEITVVTMGFSVVLPVASLMISVVGAFILGEDRRAYGENRTWAPCFVYATFIVLSISFLLTHTVFVFYPTALQEAMYASMIYSIITAVVPLVCYTVYLLLPRCEEKCCQCNPSSRKNEKPKELKFPPNVPPSWREGGKQQKDMEQSSSSVAKEVEELKKKAIVEPENKEKDIDEALVTGTDRTEEKKKKKEPVKDRKESAKVFFSLKEGHLNMEDGYEDFGPGEEEGGTKEATVYDVDDTGDTAGLSQGTAAQSSNVLRQKSSNGAGAVVVDKRRKNRTPKMRPLNSGEKRVKKSKAPSGRRSFKREDDKNRVMTVTAVEKKTTGISRKKKSKPEKKDEAKKTTNVEHIDQKTQRSEEN